MRGGLTGIVSMTQSRNFITQSPENSETPLEEQLGWITPTPLFFVRNHFDVPKLDPATWRLRVDGFVEKPCEWSYQQLLDLPRRSVFATMECAGNGRSFLSPPPDGVRWNAG